MLTSFTRTLQRYDSLTLLLWLIVLMSPFRSMANNDNPTSFPHFEIGENDFLLDGKPIQIRCGEMHYTRVPREYWKHRIEMIKSMGMNAVCVYLFWNYHERKEGEFTWDGQADVVEFCKLAQESGLWVVLRPGPYSCAEWEMGGLPWWLLKHEGIQLRTTDERYMSAVRRYIAAVGRQLADMQVSRGGPILMAQVENEYGFYGSDPEYMGQVRQALVDAGFDIPLFACNPPYHLERGYREDLFQVVNFGSDPKSAFEALRKVQANGPLMCGEFYPGWFDTWGNPHHTGKVDNYIGSLNEMMELNASFSIYMVHGGTTFGFWAGADRPFKPDTTSYDYDAPISESGLTTPQFFRLRELMQSYLPKGETLPEPPAPNPTIAIDSFAFDKVASVFDNTGRKTDSSLPLNFEKLDQSKGAVIYKTHLPSGPAATLEASAVNDFGWVYLDGKPLGSFDRRSRAFSLKIPERASESTLEILVYAMGRINFGPEVHDRKGLIEPVTLNSPNAETIHLQRWQNCSLEMDDDFLASLDFQALDPSKEKIGPSFWKSSFELTKTGDTYLDMTTWGKGFVWVNGYALGRFWNIGPTQTMYLPGPWLKKGRNEIIVLDLLGPETAQIAGIEEPILDTLRPELDFSGPRRPLRELRLNERAPSYSGSFDSSTAVQNIDFRGHHTGRFFCLKSRNSHKDDPIAALAEIDLLDEQGELISHERWTIAYVSSEERYEIDGTAENAIDGQTASYWSSYFAHNTPHHPHTLVLELGEETTLSGARIVPVPGEDNPGRIRAYDLFIGNGLVTSPK